MQDPASQTVYKLTTLDEWSLAVVTGDFSGSPDDLRDGYIHLSCAGQLEGTANKYFQGVEGLVLVAFEAASLGETLKWEASRGGAVFPHLYSALPTTAAVWVRPVPLDEDGAPVLPDLGPDDPASEIDSDAEGASEHAALTTHDTK